MEIPRIEVLFLIAYANDPSLGHIPVIVKRAVIGSKDGWKLSIIFKL